MKVLITRGREYLEYPHPTLSIEIFGKIKPTGLDKMRVTMKFSRESEVYPYRKNVDLYHQDQTENLIRELADHFILPLVEVRKCIVQLTNELDIHRIELMEEKLVVSKILSEEERKEAEKYLSSANLMKHIQEDIGKTGVVGEEMNRTLAYVAATSRMLSNPLHLYSVGSTGIGKTYLQHQITKLIPDEDIIQLTTITDQSLDYFTKEQINMKLLCIEDLGLVSDDVLGKIRELQVNKRLTKSVVDKSQYGESRTIIKSVEARVSIFGTTTKINLYEDNINRVLVVHPDTSAIQQNAITEYMKLNASGKVNTNEQQKYIVLLQNIQRVLTPIRIINPFAMTLTLPQTVTAQLRTMNIYLGLIEAITFLNQFKREVKKDKDGSKYIESTQEDIEWANKLFMDTLIAKSDDLSPSVRSFLEELKKLFKKSEAFTTKELKPHFRISSATIIRYLRELLSKEYITAAGNKFKGLQYTLREDQDFDRINKEIKGFGNKSEDE